MLLNGVDIFTSKVFSLTPDKKLKFTYGKHRGKTIDDFKKVSELHDVTSYCFYIVKGVNTKGEKVKEFNAVTKYVASVFLKELTEKFSEFEIKLRRIMIEDQKEKLKKNEESAKTTGKKYA